MTNLGDYLGQLMSEVVMARVQADLETVRVAELYASHPLLRHMAIPRVRLPEIEMEVPVVIAGSDDPREGESPRGGPTAKDARKQFDKLLQKHLSTNRVRLSADHRKALTSALDEAMDKPDIPVEVAVDTYRFADRLTKAAIGSLSDTIGKEKASAVSKGLDEDARLTLLALRSPPPRISALVETAQVREAGPAESVTRLRLTIREDSMELTTIESEDGTQTTRLVPE